MAYFLQQLINGITLGAIYGLIAIGYTMVYGIIGMINFAHGEIYMIGAFISVICFTALGLLGITWVPLALLIVLVIAMVFTAVYGWTVERIAYRPLRGSSRLAPLISAIGMSIFLQNDVQLLQGARIKPLQPVIEGGFILTEMDGFAVHLGYIQIFIVFLTVVLMALFSVFIARTDIGRAQRACSASMSTAPYRLPSSWARRWRRWRGRWWCCITAWFTSTSAFSPASRRLPPPSSAESGRCQGPCSAAC